MMADSQRPEREREQEEKKAIAREMEEKKLLEKYNKKKVSIGELSQEYQDILKVEFLSHVNAEYYLDEESNQKILELLFKQIKSVLKFYIDLAEEYYDIIAIWIIGTYLHDNFNSFPYLFINAMRGSGKSRLLDLISVLSRNGEHVVSLREAVLFRTAKGKTLCIDEFEGIGKKENTALRELLNASYKKGVKVQRMRKIKGVFGEEQVVEEFEPYTPIAMANIWGMEEVLGDRCLTLILEKSSNKKIMKIIEDFEINPDVLEIKKVFSLIQCSLCSVVTLKKHLFLWNPYVSMYYYHNITTLNTYTTITTLNYNTTQDTLQDKKSIENLTKEMDAKTLQLFDEINSSEIQGRNLEICFPLLLTANLIGKEIFNILLKSLLDITGKKVSEELAESKDIQLIDYVSRQENETWISVKRFTGMFKSFISEDEDDEEEKWINSKWLGRALKRLNLVKFKRRVGQGIEIVLDLEKAKNRIKNYR